METIIIDSKVVHCIYECNSYDEYTSNKKNIENAILNRKIKTPNELNLHIEKYEDFIDTLTHIEIKWADKIREIRKEFFEKEMIKYYG